MLVVNRAALWQNSTTAVLKTVAWHVAAILTETYVYAHEYQIIAT